MYSGGISESPAGLSGLGSLRFGNGATHCDLDLLRTRFLALRHANQEHSVIVRRLDVLRVQRVRQRERAGERSIDALHTMISVLLHFILEAALTAESQNVVFNANVDILLADARKVGLED